HGPGQLGELAEALDELRLDAQHPPRVLVDPVGGPLPGQQSLVVGGFGHKVAPHHRLTLPTFAAIRSHTAHAIPPEFTRCPLIPAYPARTGPGHRPEDGPKNLEKLPGKPGTRFRDPCV